MIFAAESAPHPGIESSEGAVLATKIVILRSSSLTRPFRTRMRSSSSSAISTSVPSRRAGTARRGPRRTRCAAHGDAPQALGRARADASESGPADVFSHAQASRGGRPVAAARETARRAAQPGRSGSRQAARATASASIGSDFPGVRALRLAPTMRCVGTRATVSPSAQKIRLERTRQMPAVLKRPPSTRPPSGPRQGLHVPVASRRHGHRRDLPPSSSAATNVCVRLCASAPITTSTSPILSPFAR